MQFIEDKKTGKILEVFLTEEQKNAYYFEILCGKDIKKMRQARLEIDKRIDELVDAKIKQYQTKALVAEKSLVYSLGRKTKDSQIGLYHSLKELQPLASFNYQSDIDKLKEKYNINGDSDVQCKTN